MSGSPKPPPAWMIDGIGHVRAVLGLLRRSVVPANVAVFELAQGAWLTQALSTASRLGIFAALAEGPTTADDVAHRVGTDPRAMLKTIIHDWDDDDAVNILRNVRRAIAPNGRLALIELVLPEGPPWHPGMMLDLEMLIAAGGRERTATKYAELLSQTGFRQTCVVPTAGPMSVVEALPG